MQHRTLTCSLRVCRPTNLWKATQDAQRHKCIVSVTTRLQHSLVGQPKDMLEKTLVALLSKDFQSNQPVNHSIVIVSIFDRTAAAKRLHTLSGFAQLRESPQFPAPKTREAYYV